MSIIGSNILAGAAGSGVSAYEIEQSLRFDGGAYLNRTPGSAGNRKTWTWSGWVKRSKLGAYQNLFTGGAASPAYDGFRFTTVDALQFYQQGGTATNLVTTAVFRDVSAWYHVVLKLNSTASEAAIFVNGVEQTVTGTQPTNTDRNINNTIPHAIGAEAVNSTFLQPIDGYMAEVHFADGQALDATSFGEYDDNGVWRPIRYTGSYGTNGFYLKFDPTATNGIGHDHSGNGNNFTASGFTTSGTGTDVMSDTPTTNYATLNPLRPSSYGAVSLSNGNLNASQSTTAYEAGTGTIGVSSGKWYWEVDCNSVGFVTSIGITNNVTANGPGATGVYTYHYDGKKYVNGSLQNYSGNSYTNGDLLGFALDLDAGTLVAYKNGTSQGTLETGLSGTFYPYVTLYGTRNVTFNFGQTAFQQTVPTGYSALNTASLPAPDIADGGKYFDTVLWTGNGAAGRSITGLNFSPDLVWLKNRSDTYTHQLHDAVRGASSGALYSNLTNTQDPNFPLTSFDSAGFTLGDTASLAAQSQGSQNYNGNSFVAWCWDAGGSGSSNTDGSITSTVSANPTAGFSIVTYTGTGANATVGHGLGVALKMAIIKRRDVGSNWAVYHDGFGPTKVALLDSSIAPVSQGSTYWQNTAPSDTVVTLGTTTVVNGLNGTYVAYCFAEVEGYSKFGSYTGNGSTDGPFVYCGFRPAFVMIKRTDTSNDWGIWDVARNTYNPLNKDLYANLSNQEFSTYNRLDCVSNGFKLRHDGVFVNALSGTYIYMAFAEHPTGGSGVSPATAR